MRMRIAKSARKAQTISFDALIGVGLFIVAVILLFYITGRESKGKESVQVEDDSEKLTGLLSSPQNTSISIVSGSKVDSGRLEELSMLQYELIKAQAGTSADFCIFFEDEKGNVIPLPDGRIGIGNAFVNISGKACNGTMPP